MSPQRPRIAVQPDGVRPFLAKAVEEGGGQVVAPESADALVWTETEDAPGLTKLLDAHPGVGWVQLPFAGVEPYVDVIRSHADRTWTCGKGVYAEPVAEHALALALAGRRALDRYSRADTWTEPRGRNLLHARVTILGGGGIAQSLLRLLVPFGCDVTVVRATPRQMPGAARVVGKQYLDDALAGADLLVVALALVPSTTGIVNRSRLDLLAEGAGLVNVARGQHVVTDDLVPALDDGPLASVGLDVTDPEPLPDDHPLWHRPDVIITPHTANTPEMALPLLSARVTENVRRFTRGDTLVGPVDPEKGY